MTWSVARLRHVRAQLTRRRTRRAVVACAWRPQLARVAAEAGLPMVCPPVRLCMDNGIMVGWTGIQRLRLGLADAPLGAHGA
jgi:hypothetical protein